MQSKINEDALKHFEEMFARAETDRKLFVSEFLTPSNYINPKTGLLGVLEPNKPQEKWMTNSSKPVNVWAAGNSTGKSYGSALKAIHWGAYKKKINKSWTSVDGFTQAQYKILLTGPESKQAMALFEQVERLLKNSPFLSSQITNITMGTKRDPHARIEMEGNWSIHAISTKGKGSHIESGDYDLIIFDEPADEPHLVYVIEKVLQPRMFRRGGVLDLVGTPKGNPNFFDYYVKGAGPDDDYYDPSKYDPDGYYSQNNSSYENPFADEASISAYANSKDDKQVEERIMGKFVTFSEVAFPLDVIDEVIDVNMKDHYEPSSGRQYITGVDFGRKQDYTVAITLDITERPWQMVDFGRWGGGTVSWEFIFTKLYGIFNLYKSEFFVDSTSAGGDMQIEWLRSLEIYYKPFLYSPASKVKLINNLQDSLARKYVKIPHIQKLKEELRFYPRDLDDKKIDTDCVMALALAVFRARDYASVGEPYDY